VPEDRAGGVEARLLDGSPPATPAELFRRLDGLGIAHHTRRHAPVYTVEEARAVRGELPGVHTKNLFVRDKKERMWLLVCEADRDVDLHDVARRLGSKRLSFGSPRRLMHYLGVTPGAVNPFAVMNDRTNAVQVVLDTVVLEGDPINFHPLDNAMTTAVSARDMVRFLEAERHAPTIMDFGGRVSE